MDKVGNYFRVTEASEAQNALSMLHFFLEHSKTNIYFLKWSIIAAHNGLQCLMVLALGGTSALQVIKWKNEYNSISQYEILTDANMKLDNFLELYKKYKIKSIWEIMHLKMEMVI